MLYLKALAAAVLAIFLWSGLVLFGAISGWWISSDIPAGDTKAFMAAATDIVESGNRGNVGLVLIKDGDVAGELFVGAGDEISRDTLFQAASMSKWITAHAVMRLAQDGAIDLDQPVDDYLRRWKLPQVPFDNGQVTTRLLLSHTAGLVDGLGFGDYEPDETVPTTVESLNQPRASNGEDVAIEVGSEPGSGFSYSGGGYLILQLLVEDVTGESFEDYVARTFFEPLAMTRSTFDYIGDFEDISRSFDRSGRPAPLYRYAAVGATGFSTSAGDMTRFVRSKLGVGGTPFPLDPAFAGAMHEPHASVMGLEIWGLGTILYAPTDGGGFVVGHDGQNDPAINAAVRINPETRDALIAFSSGGQALATRLGYEWTLWQTGRPDALHTEPAVRQAVPMLLAGIAVILIAMIALTWRQRRRSR